MRNQISELVEERARSFYYHDDTDPKSQTRIVFDNEQKELDLARAWKYFCESPRRSIYDFRDSMIAFFVRLFDASDGRVEILKSVYFECLRRPSQREVFDTIGQVLQHLQSADRELYETHFIVRGKKIYKKRPPTEECLYEVEFRSKDVTITDHFHQKFTIVYRNPVFQYEFLLLP